MTIRFASSLLVATLASAPALHAAPQAPPGEGPALGNNRITQSDITGGSLTVREIRRKGMLIFSTPFNKHDGMGDGPVDVSDPTAFGGRVTIGGNGTWLRVNGLDSQTCLECHSVLSNDAIPSTFAVGGVGGIGASAMPAITSFDLADLDGNQKADINGRAINPPFIFGSGGVEALGKEMTQELQVLKATAQANPGTPVSLDTKGVNFGSITYDGNSQTFDTSAVEGIEDDLVVRPFGRKGEFASIRGFDLGAMPFHHGMQPEEVVGTGIDADGDGVANEISIGEISALHIFSVSTERPEQRFGGQPDAVQGAQLFAAIGCVQCHVPSMDTSSPFLPVAFPEVDTDPTANVFYTIDLTASAGFDPSGSGGVTVELYSDLKRHDMGPALAETTGGALDPFFVTPRLWGVADTAPYLHDGRALTLTAAIEAHGGEGQQAADSWASLSNANKTRVLTFLRTLRTPRNPNANIKRPAIDSPSSF